MMEASRTSKPVFEWSTTLYIRCFILKTSKLRTPVGLEDVGTYPNLFAALIESGWREKDLAKLAGGNLLRVFQEVEKVNH